jgi:hypothetical protein
VNISLPRGLLFNVGFGFTISLLLLLAVIGLGVTQMAQINNEMENVVSVNNVKTRLASRMRDTLRDRAVLMHNIVVSIDPWEKDELFLRFLDYGGRYAQDRAELRELLKSEEEKQLMAALDDITSINQPVMLQVIESALDENNYGALTLLQQSAIPLQNRLVEALDNMTRLQREANEAALKQNLRRLPGIAQPDAGARHRRHPAGCDGGGAGQPAHAETNPTDRDRTAEIPDTVRNQFGCRGDSRRKRLYRLQSGHGIDVRHGFGRPSCAPRFRSSARRSRPTAVTAFDHAMRAHRARPNADRDMP